MKPRDPLAIAASFLALRSKALKQAGSTPIHDVTFVGGLERDQTKKHGNFRLGRQFGRNYEVAIPCRCDLDPISRHRFDAINCQFLTARNAIPYVAET
jgi:hypothetical protein